ncbi:MAG: 1,4-alpha-glucan branching protein GlgB, partial [Acetivibrio sp.]
MDTELLYEKMDWARIEAVVYSEEDQPIDFLGAHKQTDGILIQAFFPDALSVEVKEISSGKVYQMEMEDEAGFFAAFVSKKKMPEYVYVITYKDGVQVEKKELYGYEPLIDAMDQQNFESGIYYDVYEKMGAHPMKRKDVSGVNFAVWAPNAIRVSVVGDFNLWDGRINQMQRLGQSGIFEIFVPEVEPGMIYKYEIKLKNGLSILKADPYAFYAEKRPNNASIVCDLDTYKWKDSLWMKNRKKKNFLKEPISIYELHIGSWKKPKIEGLELEETFYNYRELAPLLADYIKDMGYTHIELLPVMEHPFDGSWGYQVTGFYAATARYGTPEDFMYFMDYMHQKEIGVILDWVPAHFPKDAFGLACFDGTCLYENADPRRGTHPHWGTLIFDYGKPQVSNFLLSNTIFWIEKYHVDGIRMDAVASMLYLDYGKEEGEWLPNIYGGNENLEAIEFLKHVNSILKKREDGSLVIAEESTSWPMITKKVDEGGLGFDFKWNMGWMNDFIDYMKTDPLFRSGKHGELTFSMIYAYSENFVLVLSHDEVVHGKGSMIEKMPGTLEEKFANLRVAYGFMMTHPGKKLLFMGQDFAQISEWNEKKELDWLLLEQNENHQKMQSYVRALNHLYGNYPALYQLDYDEEGFEWLSSLDGENSVVSFLRRSKDKKDDLMVVCNFTPVLRKDFRLGVPYAGKYKEIFNSDSVEFGGQGNGNSRVKIAKKLSWDGRDHSVQITLPGLAVCVFSCTPEEKKTVEKKATDKKAIEKKATEKKATEKK